MIRTSKCSATICHNDFTENDYVVEFFSLVASSVSDSDSLVK